MVEERGGLFGPTRENERIILLDALRGFALLGVLLVNLRDLTLFSFLTESARAALDTAAWDHWLDLGMAALVDVKAFTIFTLLFGVGFALQAERATAAGEGLGRYGRRLLILFAIGLAHAYLFWWGDILRLYALLGLFLMPAARLRPRTLVILGLFIAVFLTPLLRPIMGALLPPIQPSAQASAAALNAFQGSSLTAMWKANFVYDTWTRISAWGLPFYVLGRLLIGAAIGRSGLLRDPQRHRRLWIRLLSILLPLGVALTAFIILRDHGAFGPMQGWWRTEPARALIRVARSGASLALGLAYVAVFVLLFQRPGCRWLQVLAPIGRMALTNYILQTVIAVLFFYGVGFGIGPRFGLAGVLVATVIIFAAQLVASRWWLERFQFGPLEWIWRTLTYGRRQPMRRVRNRAMTTLPTW
jgi:uncharacterized protein